MSLRQVGSNRQRIEKATGTHVPLLRVIAECIGTKPFIDVRRQETRALSDLAARAYKLADLLHDPEATQFDIASPHHIYCKHYRQS